jgi:hypothetical protein
MTGEEFLGRLNYYANAWLPARDLVVSALTHRNNVDPSGKILLFEQFAPWKVHAFLQAPNIEIQLSSRNIYLNSRLNCLSQMIRNQFMLSIRTRLPETTAFKLYPCPLKVLKAVKRCLKHGEVSGTMSYPRQRVSMAEYLFTRAVSLVVSVSCIN